MKFRKLFTDREVVTLHDLNRHHQVREKLKSRKMLLYEATKNNWEKIFKEMLRFTLKITLNV